jgi:hypothetical protein
MEALDGEVTLLGALEEVDLVGRAPEQLLAAIARHLEEALVHLDVPQVRQAADHRRRRVGIERALEAFFRLEAVRRVLQDQHEAVGHAVGIVDDEAADPMHPLRLVAARRRHLDDDVVEGFARDDALDRVAAVLERMVVAIGELEILAVLLDVGAKRLEAVDAVHRERGLVRPGQRLVRLDEDDPVGEASDDELQLRTIDDVGGTCRGGAVFLRLAKRTQLKLGRSSRRCRDRVFSEVFDLGWATHSDSGLWSFARGKTRRRSIGNAPP